MSCRVCLRKGMKVYYKINSNFIDLIKKLTKVKLKKNEVVCCFCLATLRKILKFANTIKEVDANLRLIHNIAGKGINININKYYNYTISTTTKTSTEDPIENESCKIAGNIKEEPVNEVNNYKITGLKEIKVEFCHLSEDFKDNNDDSSKYMVPFVTVSDGSGAKNQSGSFPNEEEGNSSPTKTQIPPSNEHKRNVNVKTTKNPKEINKTLNTSHSNNVTTNQIKVRGVYDQNVIKPKIKKLLSCDVCPFKCRCKSQMIIHSRKHTGERPFSCNICSRSYKLNCELTSHLRTHTGEKPFSCDICSYKSTTKCNLKSHILIKHSEKKRYTCDVCAFRCCYKNVLKIHLRTHTGEKPFSCNICSFRCNRSTGLKSHLRTHTDEKHFACNVCSKKFTQSIYLKIHLKTHTDEKPFACSICSYRSRWRNGIVNHLRTHTGEKPYSCEICSFKFNRLHHLKRHLKTHKSNLLAVAV